MKDLPNGVRELRSKEPVLMPARRRDHRRLDLAIAYLPRRNLGPRAEFNLGDRVGSAPAIEGRPTWQAGRPRADARDRHRRRSCESHRPRPSLATWTRSPSSRWTMRGACRPRSRSARRATASGRPIAGAGTRKRRATSRSALPPSASRAATRRLSSATTVRSSTGPCSPRRRSAGSRCRSTRTPSSGRCSTSSTTRRSALPWSRTRSRWTSCSTSRPSVPTCNT